MLNRSCHLYRRTALGLGLAVLTFSAFAQDSPDLKTEKEKFSYALGMKIGSGFRNDGVEIDPSTFAKALTESMKGGRTVLTEDEMRTVLADAQAEYRKNQEALRAEKAKVELEQGEKFLTANKNKEGIVALPSGLQYKVLKQGKGEKPEIDEEVVCNYRGMLRDGTQFDSSDRHSGPVTFPVRGVIKGWTEALLMMPAGSKWQLFVPGHLAYGEEGAGQTVPPNATLVFELELLSVKEKDGPERDRE